MNDETAIYKIVGDDGKEYGPATAGQIRQWISEQRIERDTPIFVAAAKDWNFVGLLPEFAGFFSTGAHPPTIAPVPSLRRTNPLATAGLVCGILSLTLICCCGGFPFNVLGLIFSIIALMQISENPLRFEGRGIAIAGLILSAIGILFLLFALASNHARVNFYSN
jgi:hypothetical protein